MCFFFKTVFCLEIKVYLFCTIECNVCFQELSSVLSCKWIVYYKEYQRSSLLEAEVLHSLFRSQRNCQLGFQRLPLKWLVAVATNIYTIYLHTAQRIKAFKKHERPLMGYYIFLQVLHWLSDPRVLIGWICLFCKVLFLQNSSYGIHL